MAFSYQQTVLCITKKKNATAVLMYISSL